MPEDWLAEFLGISQPKKRKKPMEEASEFWSNVATGAGTLALLFQVSSWLFEKKK